MRKRIAVVALLCVVFSLAPARGKERYQQPGAINLDRAGEKWARKTLKSLSLEEKIGQMLMVWARVGFTNLQNPDYLRLRDMMRQYHLGSLGLTVRAQGALLFKSEPYEAAALVNQFQSESKLPLLIAADFERGLAMRLEGVTGFPHAMAFGAAGNLAYAEEFGRITAQEARAIGVHWNFFPVADVNSNPVNPIINTRAFGEDPQQVGDMVTAYIKGAHEFGMLTTAKHFPGHGDTATDTHLGVAQVSSTRARLDAVELPPFRAAIESGVDAVMVAHVTVPALEPDPNRVATTSPAIIQSVLRNELGFRGLVVTDAFDMNGLMRFYARRGGVQRAAVEAVKAGNDMIIIPPDMTVHDALVRAVRHGEIPESRIDESVLRILRVKASLGLHKARLVSLEALSQLISQPKNLAFAQQVADDALTLVRDNGYSIPLRADSENLASLGTMAPRFTYARVVERQNRVVAVIFTDDVRADMGREFERQLRSRVPEANIISVDPRNAAFSQEAILSTVSQAEHVIAAVYVVPISGKAVKINGMVKNTVSLTGSQAALLHGILRLAAEKTVVVSLGNPYLVSSFPETQTYLCTFSSVAVSEVSAVKALFGEIPIGGRLPITIPGIAARDQGVERPLVGMRGGSHGQEKVLARR